MFALRTLQAAIFKKPPPIMKHFVKRSLTSAKNVEPPCDDDVDMPRGEPSEPEEEHMDGKGGASSKTPIFERPKRRELPGEVRLGFIPEEWFQFFYCATGVTGPYVFGLGLFTYLASKEYYVMEHEYYSGLSLAIMAVVATKKLGPPLAKWLDKEVDRVDADFKQYHVDELRHYAKAIENERLEQWRAEGALLLVEAKRRNIELQIEAAFREELHRVYLDVMNKLEYHVARHHIEQRILHKQMIIWVATNVICSLPPMEEEETLKTRNDMSARALQLLSMPH